MYLSPLDMALQGRADSTSGTTSSSTQSITSTSASSSGSSTTASTSTSSSSSSSSSSTTSSSSTASTSSASSTQSSSSSTSASSTSASTSASSTPSSAPSKSNSKLIGGIIGGVIGGLVVLTLVSVLFTMWRRRRNDARKRPRGSVYIGGAAPRKGRAMAASSDLDSFFSSASQKPALNAEHTSSSVPLLSVHDSDGTTVGVSADDADPSAPPHLPSPYSDHGHGEFVNHAGDEDSAHDHSGILPSPYSQIGHGGDSEATEGLPAPRLVSREASPRPESQFYAPIAVPSNDFSLAVLEASVSRPGTPAGLDPRATTPSNDLVEFGKTAGTGA